MEKVNRGRWHANLIRNLHIDKVESNLQVVFRYLNFIGNSLGLFEVSHWKLS